PEHPTGVGQGAGAVLDVALVGQARARPRPGFDDDVVAAVDELAHTGRRQRHAVLVGLDLGRDANLHVAGTSLSVIVWKSKTVPTRSSSAKRSSADSARSGGCTPVTGRRPLASRRTVAAATDAVDTTPPPSPHASC